MKLQIFKETEKNGSQFIVLRQDGVCVETWLIGPVYGTEAECVYKAMELMESIASKKTKENKELLHEVVIPDPNSIKSITDIEFETLNG